MAKATRTAESSAESAQGLIAIGKAGEPDLHIHPDALDEHVTLGWEVIDKLAEQAE
ncbi:hypothetical protein CNECB9_2370103 [Cupriavidus necator]|uniref:Uncharacterized protein n=1 Tax=Cupriavidus necator TaxID=106590 RepID=A0A1K0IDX4_CUPNE|nr:hypothetical protein CNECB9_2370103 [Cupriavidus necator]